MLVISGNTGTLRGRRKEIMVGGLLGHDCKLVVPFPSDLDISSQIFCSLVEVINNSTLFVPDVSFEAVLVGFNFCGGKK